MSLNLEVTKKSIGELEINFEELKSELEVSLTKYKGILVTKETLAEAKKDKALLNKVAKTINDRKIELKKEFLKPYENVEKQAKELIEMINAVSSEIDVQIKVFDENEKNEKMKEIIDAWEAFGFNLVPLEKIFNDKWLNKTFTLNNIVSEMQDFITKTKNELAVIEQMFNWNKLEAQTKYLQTLDLYKTIEMLKAEEEIKNQLSENNAIEVDETKYSLCFKVVTTKEKIKALSRFLKENKIEYERIDEEN